MRNWNCPKCSRHAYAKIVSSLPMRNWNIPFNILPILFCHCIQPTYEELKQNLNRELLMYCRKYPAYLWGIETKFASNFPLVLSIRIQPTYEELKLDSEPTFLGATQGIQPTYEELKPSHISVSFRRSRRVSSLPMRNWNLNASGRFLFYLYCIQPTYEELKRTIARMRGVRKIAYPAYLWGIETIWSSRATWMVLVYPAYLWGIETVKHASV